MKKLCGLSDDIIYSKLVRNKFIPRAMGMVLQAQTCLRQFNIGERKKFEGLTRD